MMLKKTMLAAALAATLATPVMAGDIAAGVIAGTAGLGAELTYGVTDNINLRGSLRGLNRSYDFTEDNINYSGDIKLRNGGVTVDWFPFSGGFHLSAGALYNGNKIIAKAKPSTGTAVYNINNENYYIDGHVNADIDWRKFAPYLGIGWGNPVRKGSNLSFTFDVGVMFMGEPNSDLSATGRYSTDGVNYTDVYLNDPNNPFTKDIQAEQARLNDEIKDAKFWPVIQLGLHYKF